MKQTTYLILMMLIAGHFLDILPLGYIMDMNGGLIGTLMLYFWMYYGIVYYKNKSTHQFYTSENRKPIIWILVGIFISFD